MKQFLILLTVLFVIGLIIIGSFAHTLPARAQVTAGIIVEPTAGLITDENGGSDSFTVQLDTAAPPNVKIYFSSSDPSEGTVFPESINLNPSNWDTPEQNIITVTGVADGIEDGDIAYEIIGATSIDGPAVFSVSVTNLNDSVPVANDDYPSIDGDSPIIIPVLENDTGLNNTPLELSIITGPSNGTTSVNADNTITYTPVTFAGIDQFTYMVCDADLDPDCATAEVILEDQVPPVILSVSPVEVGEIFEISSGDVIIEVEASDNFLVDCVDFIRWDDQIEQYIELGNVCQAPYAVTVNAGTLNFGWNQVYFQVSDMAGNLSEHEFIWLFRVHRNYIPLVIAP